VSTRSALCAPGMNDEQKSKLESGPGSQLNSTQRTTSSDLPLRGSNLHEDGLHGHFQTQLVVPIREMGQGLSEGPMSPIRMDNTFPIPEASSAQVETWSSDRDRSRTPSGDFTRREYAEASRETMNAGRAVAHNPLADVHSATAAQSVASTQSWTKQRSSSPRIVIPNEGLEPDSVSAYALNSTSQAESRPSGTVPGLQYHHQRPTSENSEDSSRGERTSPRLWQRLVCVKVFASLFSSPV
jgi:hypothetical protein